MNGRSRLAAAAAVAVLAFFASPSCAQNSGASNVLVNIPRLAQMVITGDVSNLLSMTLDGAGASAYDSGRLESAADGTVLVMSTNDRWDLSARLGGQWSCPGTYDKEESDLRIRISNTPTGTIQSGASSFISLSGSDTQILSHDAAVSSNAVDIQTEVLLDWTKDIPGTYGITVTYTLVTHLP